MGRMPMTTMPAVIRTSRMAAVSFRENTPLRMPLRRTKYRVVATMRTNPMIRTQNQKKGISVSTDAVAVSVLMIS